MHEAQGKARIEYTDGRGLWWKKSAWKTSSLILRSLNRARNTGGKGTNLKQTRSTMWAGKERQMYGKCYDLMQRERHFWLGRTFQRERTWAGYGVRQRLGFPSLKNTASLLHTYRVLLLKDSQGLCLPKGSFCKCTAWPRGREFSQEAFCPADWQVSSRPASRQTLQGLPACHSHLQKENNKQRKQQI